MGRQEVQGKSSAETRELQQVTGCCRRIISTRLGLSSARFSMNILRTLVAVLLAHLVGLTPALSQERPTSQNRPGADASLRVVVLDQSDAVLAEATVQIKLVGKGLREARTNDRGEAGFSKLK